jgi:hypothetical protein
MFLDEKSLFPSNHVFENGGYGHYSQIMWRKTTSVGCGLVGKYLACRYSPAGNVMGALTF